MTNCEITPGLARFLRGVLADTITSQEQALAGDMLGDPDGLLDTYRERLQELERALEAGGSHA